MLRQYGEERVVKTERKPHLEGIAYCPHNAAVQRPRAAVCDLGMLLTAIRCNRLLGGRVGLHTIDFPRHTKLINDNAKTRRPKRGLKRKTDSAALGQLRKYLMGARGAFHRERYKKPLRLDVVHRQ